MIQNIELEQNILGCYLINDQSFHAADGILSPDDFSDPVHRDIFEIIQRRARDGELVSPVVLKSMMESHEGLKQLGGPAYLARLAGAAISVFAIRDHCKELREVTKRRNLKAVLEESIAELEGETPASHVAGQIEASLIESDDDNNDNVVSLMVATVDAAKKASEAHAAEGVIGVTTGLADVDRMLGGFLPGELILLGGRPSMGKTACALAMALSAARKGDGVVIASLEMTPDSLALRAIANEAAHHGNKIAYTDAKRGTMTDEQAEAFFRTTQAVAELPIHILPSNMRDMGAIYAGVKKSKRLLEAQSRELKLVVIDYLQLIQPSKQARSRVEQITEISIALKSLAMRMNVPVMALSQLSRSLESRDNKRPILSDLRESGQLEQDADTVMFCYRADYYLERDQPDESKVDEVLAYQEAMDAVRGKLEIIVSKQRMGAVGTVKVGFNPATNFMWDATDYSTA